MQPTSSKYRPDIDGLRGIAVLLVVGFHAFPTLVRGGFIGVDVFFVISGYLISGIIVVGASQGNFSFYEFYGRRIRRIFPALLVALVCCIVYGWFFLLPHDFAQLGKHIAGGAGFISNFVLFSESGYFDAASDTKPLIHLWSLGIEEQFYIFWPFLIWLFCWRRWNVLAFTLVLSIASFALNVADIKSEPVATFYLPQTRLWELLTGAVLAITSLRRPAAQLSPKDETHVKSKNGSAWSRNARSIIGILCILIGLGLIDERVQFPGWWAALPTAGTALIISAGPQAWLNRILLSNAALVWFGLISFPLYIWHWPLLSMATLLRGEFPSRNIRIAIVGTSIAAAWITYRFVEMPIRFRRNGGKKAIALLVALGLVGYLGYRCYRNEGYPSRFPKIVQEIDQFEHKYDHQAAWRERSCFLELDQSYSAFSACDPSQWLADKPIIFIWGDSLAAQLYPGYERIYGGKFTVVQRTASACAPIFDDAYNDRLPNCKAVNDYVIGLIKERKPNRVVLSARWSVHDWKKVGSTISELRRAGVTHIDLIGPVPRWKTSLPRQLILYVQMTNSKFIPERMTFGLEPGYKDIESQLVDLADKSRVNYVSPVSILCDDRGCMTRTGDGINTITSFDYDHLTEAGSVFLVSRIPAD
jgi:peptidoglycan/LPS O-acetylase OafA/YrhL